MEALQIALLQYPWAGKRPAMVAQVQELVAQAAAQGATLICLPEFSLSPYFASTTDKAGFDWAEALTGGETDQVLGALARQYGVWIIGSLFERTPDGAYFDTATLHHPQGELAYFTRKVHIPSGEGYHEDHFFGGAADYPVHSVAGVNLSVPTCYDQWFPEVARISALNGAEFIFYPTAIGSEPNAPDFDSQAAWQTVMRGHAVANGVFIGAANRVGAENGIRFYGSSFVCDPGGAILAQAGRDSTEIISATLDPAVQAQWRDLFPLLHQRQPQTYQRITEKFNDPLPQRWQDHPAFQDENSS